MALKSFILNILSMSLVDRKFRTRELEIKKEILEGEGDCLTYSDDLELFLLHLVKDDFLIDDE